MIKVYLAGPYTGGGGPEANVAAAIAQANRLLDLGYAVFVPHFSHYLELAKPRHYETWMALDFEFLPCCDVLFRMPGESAGTDREVARASELGIPIAFSETALTAWAKRHTGPLEPGENRCPAHTRDGATQCVDSAGHEGKVHPTGRGSYFGSDGIERSLQ